jgi:hypothetical protein
MKWDTFFLTHDPTDATRHFTDSILHCLAVIAPLTSRTANSKSRDITLKMKIKIRRLNSDYRRTSDFSKFIHVAELQNLIGFKDQSKKLQEEKDALTGQQKAISLSLLLKRRKPKKCTACSYLSLPDGTNTEDPQIISELFNAQFASVFIAE